MSEVTKVRKPGREFVMKEVHELPVVTTERRKQTSVYAEKLVQIVEMGSRSWIEVARYTAPTTARLIIANFKKGVYQVPKGTAWDMEARRFDLEDGSGKRGSILYVKNVTPAIATLAKVEAEVEK